MLLRLVTLASLALMFGMSSGCSTGLTPSIVRASVVRIDTDIGYASGFFVEAPDHKVYVATVTHALGPGIVVSREVSVDESTHYREVFPDVRIVALDRINDVALLELVNVPASRMPPLPLSKPKLDANITSWGNAPSNLTGRGGVSGKDGKIIKMVNFKSFDHLTNRLRSDGLVPGMVTTSGLEKGASGGPSVDAKGVVGINDLKDLEHANESGVLHVELLERMLREIKPHAVPAPNQVSEFLEHMDADYFALPVEGRLESEIWEWIPLSDGKALRNVVQALPPLLELRMVVAALPGRTLPTYGSPHVVESLAKCKKRLELLQAVEKLTPSATAGVGQDCAALSMRALGADILAASTNWSGKPRKWTVTKIEEVDPMERLYRVRARAMSEHITTTETLYVVQEGPELKLQLFDAAQRARVLERVSEVDSAALVGTWVSGPTPYGLHETLETVTVSAFGTRAHVQHNVRQRIAAPAGRSLCNGEQVAEGELSQSFQGTFNNGVLKADVIKDAASRAGTAQKGAKCELFQYAEDTQVIIKLVAGELILVRTDGKASEEIVFHKFSGPER